MQQRLKKENLRVALHQRLVMFFGAREQIWPILFVRCQTVLLVRSRGTDRAPSHMIVRGRRQLRVPWVSQLSLPNSSFLLLNSFCAWWLPLYINIQSDVILLIELVQIRQGRQGCQRQPGKWHGRSRLLGGR